MNSNPFQYTVLVVFYHFSKIPVLSFSIDAETLQLINFIVTLRIHMKMPIHVYPEHRKKTAQFHDAPQQFVMFIVASQMNPIKESSKTILTIFFLEKSPTYKDM